MSHVCASALLFLFFFIPDLKRLAGRIAEGRVYTNGVENFWNLFDRTMYGIYMYCLPQRLSRYMDEQAYRFNHRGGTDLTRFLSAMQQVVGKRLTYEELTTSHLQFLEPK